jgi:hypothetical protein
MGQAGSGCTRPALASARVAHGASKRDGPAQASAAARAFFLAGAAMRMPGFDKGPGYPMFLIEESRPE